MPAHANPIPKQWIATPEGRFAHELKIPNPVSRDSGFKEGMSAVDYYSLLCEKEAGEFTFKMVSNENGLFFARPPAAATDDDMKDRWLLEHPLLESKFQLYTRRTQRGERFLGKPAHNFSFVEEPNLDPKTPQPYWRLSGYQYPLWEKDGKRTFQYVDGATRVPGTPMKEEPVNELKSRYGMTWRGIRRPLDRENGIAGGEVIIYDLRSSEVLYVFRNYAFSGGTKATPDGVWWLTSGGCRKTHKAGDHLDANLAERAEAILKPTK